MAKENIYRMKKNVKNYFLVTLLLMNSGFPLLYQSVYLVALSTLFTLIISFIFYLDIRNKILKKSFVLYTLSFFLLFVIQVLFINFFPAQKIISFFLKFIYIYFILRFVGFDFYKIYINCIVFFTKISFFFYFPSVLFPSFKDFLIKIAFTHPSALVNNIPLKNLLIFNLNFGGIREEFLRNSGPFWEPGAFGGYMILAIFFNLLQTEDIWNKKNIILILGVLTTLSTTSYIALFLVITFNYVKKINYSFIISIPLLLCIGYYGFNNLPFLKEKIEDEITNTFSNEIIGNTRLRSLILDLRDIPKSPFVGLGLDESTRYVDFDQNGATNRNNGISDFLVKFGVLGFLIYFMSMFYGVKKIILKLGRSKKFSVLFIILIFLLGSSEMYFQFPFFFALSLSPYIINYKITL